MGNLLRCLRPFPTGVRHGIFFSNFPAFGACRFATSPGQAAPPVFVSRRNIFRDKPELVADGDRAYWIGSIYALLGDKVQALAWLRRAIDLGNHNYPWFVRDKNWDKLRGDRDYERMLAESRNHADRYRQEFGASSF